MIFSMVWKTVSRFFHGMEEMFPHYGKIRPWHHATAKRYGHKKAPRQAAAL